jgi:hypothetical protein
VSRRAVRGPRTAAVTIDVDSLPCYFAIHGLPIPEGLVDEDPIYRLAMPRFWACLEAAGLPATLFLIGADAPRHAQAFAPVGPSGSEVASHSHAHDYRLSRRPWGAIVADLAAADAALRPLNLDRPLVGFRAPGYNLSPAVLAAVADLGYVYDSSLLPAPAYFAARAAAIGAYALLGRHSRSLVGDARQFAGPRGPYRMHPAAAWTPAADGRLVELPMAVEPVGRVPLIGTVWSGLPEAVQGPLLDAALAATGQLVLELHAIDLLDASDHPALARLEPHQRDLRVPAATKLRRFETLFRRLADRAEVAPLATLAARAPTPVPS